METEKKLDAPVEKTVEAPKEEQPKDEPNRPKVFRIGNVKLTEFTNKVKDREFKNVKVCNFYKDNKGDWKESDSFNAFELRKLKLLIEEYERFNHPMNVSD